MCFPIVHSSYNEQTRTTTISLDIPDDWLLDVENPAVQIGVWLITHAAVEIHQREMELAKEA